jgi:hypothetical protein
MTFPTQRDRPRDRWECANPWEQVPRPARRRCRRRRRASSLSWPERLCRHQCSSPRRRLRRQRHKRHKRRAPRSQRSSRTHPDVPGERPCRCRGCPVPRHQLRRRQHVRGPRTKLGAVQTRSRERMLVPNAPIRAERDQRSLPLPNRPRHAAPPRSGRRSHRPRARLFRRLSSSRRSPPLHRRRLSRRRQTPQLHSPPLPPRRHLRPPFPARDGQSTRSWRMTRTRRLVAWRAPWCPTWWRIIPRSVRRASRTGR